VEFGPRAVHISSSGPFTVPGPRFQSEALPYSSSHIHYDGDGDAPVVTRQPTQPHGVGPIPSPSSAASIAPPVTMVSKGSISGSVVEPYVPPFLSTTPVTSVVYYPTPATQPSAAARGPRASATESFPLTSVGTRSRQSSIELTDPFALCLPVPFSRAVESLDNDILEAAAREADIRPPSARPAGPVVIPDLVVDSEYSDIEPMTTTSTNRPPPSQPTSVASAPMRQPPTTSASSSGAASIHPSRSSRSTREPRDNRRRPADSRLDSPSPRRRSPPRHGYGGRNRRSSRSGRTTSPSVVSEAPAVPAALSTTAARPNSTI